MQLYKRDFVRALGQFLLVFVTALAVFPAPPMHFADVWMPLMQATISALGVLGFNSVTHPK